MARTGLLTFSTILLTLRLISALCAQARQELVGRPSLQSKTFDNGNGTYTTEIGVGHTHYRNARGELLETDLNFKASADPDLSFEATQGFVQSVL